jgi:hypothetical protein
VSDAVLDTVRDTAADTEPRAERAGETHACARSGQSGESGPAPVASGGTDASNQSLDAATSPAGSSASPGTPSDERLRDAQQRRPRLFEPTHSGAAFGAAGISLLLDLLIERTRSNAWSVPRQRVHARSLLELAVDHYFSDEELAVLEAFVRES